MHSKTKACFSLPYLLFEAIQNRQKVNKTRTTGRARLIRTRLIRSST